MQLLLLIKFILLMISDRRRGAAGIFKLVSASSVGLKLAVQSVQLYRRLLSQSFAAGVRGLQRARGPGLSSFQQLDLSDQW